MISRYRQKHNGDIVYEGLLIDDNSNKVWISLSRILTFESFREALKLYNERENLRRYYL